MPTHESQASSEDARRRHQAWRELYHFEARTGAESQHSLLGTMRYDSQGRDFGRAPSPQVRNDLGSRVARVRAAMDEAPRLAVRELAQRFDQIDLGMIAHVLVSVLHDIALYVGVGAVAGGGLGFIFGGGIGALPGAALGAEAGTLALGLIGLASLVGELAKVIPAALRHYVEGFREAWGAMPEPGQRNGAGASAGMTASATFGAYEIARGHILMMSALLMGVMVWITKGGIARSRLLAEIRANPRLGAPMASWVEANERRFPAQLQRIAERDAPAADRNVLPKATPVRNRAAAPTSSAPGPTKSPSPARARAAGEETPKPDPIAERRAANEALRNSPQFQANMEKVGVSDEEIARMWAKEAPLGFKDPAQFSQFNSELGQALDQAGLSDASVGLKGTSTTFYSENPGKPLGHHWDADPLNPGDYDLNLDSPTMVQKLQDLGISPSEKYGVFKTRDINATFPELDAFQAKWSDILGRDVNFVGYPATPVRDATEYILK